MGFGTTKGAMILLSPLLAVYILICVFLIKPGFESGDEGRYAGDVKNILSGKHPTLDQAPGYPLFLTIPRAAGLSWYWLKWFNPFLLFFAIVFAARSLSVLDFDKKYIFICAYALGLYVPFWNEIQYLLTEPLALLMVSSSMYNCIRFAKTHNRTSFIFAVISLSALALIKALIGYVIIVVCAAGFVISIFREKDFGREIRKLAVIFALAFILCLPYLIYTYSLTGKIFYWANTGGENVYWLTNPVKGEYGFWNSEERVMQDDRMAHHRAFISTIPIDDRFKRDEIYMAAAKENIKTHPGKCFYNWLCNISRMFFNFPYDYKYQNSATLLYTIPNSLIFWLAVSMPLMLYKCRHRVSYPAVIIMLLLFIWVYWLGQSCSTAGPRKMYLVVPVFVVCYAFVLRSFCCAFCKKGP